MTETKDATERLETVEVRNQTNPRLTLNFDMVLVGIPYGIGVFIIKDTSPAPKWYIWIGVLVFLALFWFLGWLFNKLGWISLPWGADKKPPAWTPTSVFAKVVDLAGFNYDPSQDIIYSKMNPLQRDFGFAYGYDAAALAMDSVLDCEPIFFDYNGKTWMIELWKGQYGLETGCEIGVYNRTIGSTSSTYDLLDATVGRRENDDSPSHNQFFDCAGDDELLEMSTSLYRNGQMLLSRGPEQHWWLTGFKWGILSQPEDLTMEVSITCLDPVMTSALVNALTNMGYPDVNVSSNTVSFTFTTPHTFQPRTAFPQLVAVVNANNTAVNQAYDALELPNNDPNNINDQNNAMILDSIAIYSISFFSQVVAYLSKGEGFDPTQLMNIRTQELGVVTAEAATSPPQAGNSITSLSSTLESFFGIDLGFSCIAELSNGGPYALTLDDIGITYGNYILPPPLTILPGEVVRFWLKDPKPGMHGAGGWVQYTYNDSDHNKQTFRFTFDCPSGSSSNSVTNTSGSPFNFYTKSGNFDNNWGGLNQVASEGHPLFIAFVWGNVPPPNNTQ